MGRGIRTRVKTHGEMLRGLSGSEGEGVGCFWTRCKADKKLRKIILLKKKKKTYHGEEDTTCASFVKEKQ